MINETSLSPGLAEKLRVRVRPDLVVRRQLYEGRTHYVVKDPVGLRYFRFKEEEYFLVESLDGKRRLEEVREDYEREFRPQKIEIEELARFASQLTQAGIASVDSSGQGQVLYERFRKFQFKQRLAAWSNILYVKLPVFDPDRLLTRMVPWLSWIYHPVTVCLTILFWLTALLWVASHYDEFQARLPEFYTFFNWRNIVFMWISLGVVKIIHEFGHGVTCKYFKGECHEMGVLFLVLSPCLYCDVSDSWLLPNKWHRVWIGAAGIYVELTIASLCTFAWWNSEAGTLLNNICLSTMFVCSVNTVMFNANPLLRYDGYYMLMDMMEVPNLRQKAVRMFSSLFGKICMGLNTDTESYLPRSRRVFFVLFAVASYVYRWFISFAILWFMYRFLRPYKLGTISALLAGGALVSLLVVPSYQVGKFLWESRRMSNVSKLRLSCTVAVLSILGGMFFYLPLPHHVKASFVTAPEKPQHVWIEVPGILKEQRVKDGDWVEEGDDLAELFNPEKERELLEIQRQIDQYRTMAEAYRWAKDKDKRAEAKLAEDQANELQHQADNIRKELDRLKLKAPQSGFVIKPPESEELGSTKQKGELFCQIGYPKKDEAWVIVEQGDIQWVEKRQRVQFLFYSHALKIIEGEIRDIPNVDVEELPPELSNLAGGEVPTKTDPRTGHEKPIHTYYYAVVPLEDTYGFLQPGLRGMAKIEAKKMALGPRLWRLFKRTFHFEA